MGNFLTRNYGRKIAAITCGLSLYACQNTQEPGGQERNDVSSMLGAMQGSKSNALSSLGIKSSVNGDFQTPIYLQGQIRTDIQNPDALKSFLKNNMRQTFRLSQNTDFKIVSDHIDETNHRYIKVKQLYQNMPVQKGEMVVQLDEQGSIVAMVGQLMPDLDFQNIKKQGGDNALSEQMAKLSLDPQGVIVHEKPSLEIYTDTNNKHHLAWRSLVEYIGKDKWTLEALFISTEDGSVLAQHPHVYHALNRKIYDLKKVCLKTGSELPGTLLFNEGGSAAGDNSAMGAYNNTGTTYWFYKHFLNRDSYDNAGAVLKSSVRTTFESGFFGCDGDNAAWLGTPYSQMVYGDGDNILFKPLSLAIDVTAHELTHAVTNLTSDLTYSNESGALNEAMSDIFGATAEAWRDSGGNSSGNPSNINVSAKTWQIGEEIAGSGLPGGALRFMDNPTADKASADFYPERNTGSSDNGGVHTNSGIANLAYYLLSQGGKHPRSKTTTTVEGISISKAAKIFYMANTSLMNSSTNFQGARLATAQAAKNLFGECSKEWTNTHKAWDAVGVGGTWTPCGTGTDTQAPQVNITSPKAGATLSGSVNITANATDNVGVVEVEFYQGNALLGSSKKSPFALSWNTLSVGNGNYTLTTKAKDAAGNIGTSSSVNVTVNNASSTTKNETEPNNSFTAAQSIAAPATIIGTIKPDNDNDYFKLDLPAGATLSAALTSPINADYDLYVYNSNYSLIGASEFSAGVVDEVIVKNGGTKPLTRYVKVISFDTKASADNYRLKLGW